jgi:opacity protein-like surface antigen
LGAPFWICKTNGIVKSCVILGYSNRRREIRTMQKKALGVAISLTVSSPLHANDVSFYGGGSVLYTELENRYKKIPSALLPNDTGEFRGDDSAAALKLFGGARWGVGKGFYGLEFAYEGGQSESEIILFPMNLPSDKSILKDGASFSFSLMGGYEFLQNTYVTGRVGYISTEFDYETSSDSNPVYGSGGDTLSGVQLAIGVEHNFTDTFGMRIEYSVADYSGEIGPVAADGGTTGALAVFDDISRDAISIGIFTTF